jgi:hypothetical protein
MLICARGAPSDHRIVLEAVPISGNHTFLHLTCFYGSNTLLDDLDTCGRLFATSLIKLEGGVYNEEITAQRVGESVRQAVKRRP